MANREKKLAKALDRARELSAKDALDESETTELESVMAEAKSLRDRIVQDRTIDEFTRTISEQQPATADVEQKAVQIATDESRRYAVLADRKAFEAAASAWKSGRKDAEWGFDVRYKSIDAGVTAETNAGALDFVGDTNGEQYGGSVPPFYYPGIVEPPTRTPVVADLFAQGSTESNLVRLVKETVTTQGAAATAEGTTYGTSKIEVSPIDWPVRDITTLLPVTEDILSDIPAMSAYLGMRLAKFVQLREEAELLSGDGTGSHLTGVQHLDGRTLSAQGADDIDTAVMKLNAKVYKNSFLDPTWILMSPTTWASYVTLRTDLNGGKGQFLAGPPALAAVRTMWGLPIVVTPVVPDDRVFVGNPAAGMIFRNGGMRIESSTGYGTYFGEGLVAIRGKVRTAFAVFRPQAIGELVLGS
jgi:HK97 family phage major capsid protein